MYLVVILPGIGVLLWRMEGRSGGVRWLAGMWILEGIHLDTVLATSLPSKLACPLVQVKMMVKLMFLRRCQSKKYQEQNKLLLVLKGKVEEDQRRLSLEQVVRLSMA